MDNVALFISMTTIFVSYVSYIWGRYGVLKSISQSYYELPKKWNFIFTLAMWGFAFPAILIGVPTTGLMFFAGAGIMFVGAAATFQEKITKPVHMIGAGSGVVFSQLAIGLVYGYWPINIAFIIASLLLLLFKTKINNKHIWWIEILAFISICIVLGLIIL